MQIIIIDIKHGIPWLDALDYLISIGIEYEVHRLGNEYYSTMMYDNNILARVYCTTETALMLKLKFGDDATLVPSFTEITNER